MPTIRTLKTGVAGVRGVVGDSLTPQLLIGFAQAFGTYLDGGVVVIGRDTRPSGEMVRNALVGGLMATGCHVIDVGIAPVPTSIRRKPLPTAGCFRASITVSESRKCFTCTSS